MIYNIYSAKTRTGFPLPFQAALNQRSLDFRTTIDMTASRTLESTSGLLLLLQNNPR